jgi:hypothetical protein
MENTKDSIIYIYKPEIYENGNVKFYVAAFNLSTKEIIEIRRSDKFNLEKQGNTFLWYSRLKEDDLSRRYIFDADVNSILQCNGNLSRIKNIILLDKGLYRIYTRAYYAFLFELAQYMSVKLNKDPIEIAKPGIDINNLTDKEAIQIIRDAIPSRKTLISEQARKYFEKEILSSSDESKIDMDGETKKVISDFIIKLDEEDHSLLNDILLKLGQFDDPTKTYIITTKLD